MSIAVLNQVYDEARRLAVAGSVVARGDFRLKKLLTPLDQAGAKAPVFAKVAECARAVIDGPEESSAENLLELTSLVTAVLYTQGETGLQGPPEPIETIDFGAPAAQTSARLLKPLLEALSSTGSGRLELVKDAIERGAFRDLRLVKPALDGLDDPYSEIADLLAEKVLPLYGRATLPELRAKYDAKGTKGHPRRLKLMHALDPANARTLVKEALDNGSKEVKVAAIACLGAEAEDLAYLIEQASAKAQDVRAAAYLALAGVDEPAAVMVLEKGLAGKDFELATSALQNSKKDRMAALLIERIETDRAALVTLKDKKQVSETVRRLSRSIWALPGREHPAADSLTLDLFAHRAELAKVKGENLSGSDVVESVIQRMASSSKLLQTTLARTHAELDAGQLGFALQAARQSMTAADVFDLFSPYLTPVGGEKKKGKEAAPAKQKAIIESLGGHLSRYFYYLDSEPETLLDPRWLDLAVRMKHLGLVRVSGRPGHAATEAFLQDEFDAASKKGKSPDEVLNVISVMVQYQHPKATEAFVAAFEKTIGKANAMPYWYYYLIPKLPKSAVPLLEAVVPKLKDREAEQCLQAIQQLRDKP